jgi:hypothetical protein
MKNPRKFVQLLASLICILICSACTGNSDGGQREINTTVKEVQLKSKTDADGGEYDSTKAEKSAAILAVSLLSPGDGEKFLWDKVKVTKVLVNKTDFSFKENLEVAHYAWKKGIPEGEWLVYLTPYPFGSEWSSVTDSTQWMLVDGDGEAGVGPLVSD